MSKIYLEILDKGRKEIFHELANFKNIGYLAGGTALALQINHRISLDFDIFISKAVDNRLKLKVEKIFGKSEYYINTGDQISFHEKHDISVTFVWYYYKNLFSLCKTYSILLATPKDIAADKAHTIGRRAIWRDYVDIYFLLKKNILTLPKIISLAEKKFGGEFNQTLFLDQLVYFDDLKVVPITFIKEKPDPSEIKSFLSKAVTDYLKKVLG